MPWIRAYSAVVMSATERDESRLSSDSDGRYMSLLVLYSRYSWQLTGCFFLCQALRVEDDELVIGLLAQLIAFPMFLSFGGPAGPSASVPPTTQDAIRRLASKCIAGYGVSEVVKLLSAIDRENGIEGAMGHLVISLLMHVPNLQELLREVATNNMVDPVIRGYSVLVLISAVRDADSAFYETALRTESAPFVVEDLEYALSLLDVEGKDLK